MKNIFSFRCLGYHWRNECWCDETCGDSCQNPGVQWSQSGHNWYCNLGMCQQQRGSDEKIYCALSFYLDYLSVLYNTFEGKNLLKYIPIMYGIRCNMHVNNLFFIYFTIWPCLQTFRPYSL